MNDELIATDFEDAAEAAPNAVAETSLSGPGEEWLLEHIRHNVFTMKLNRVITAVGPPGSGKSWTGLRIGTLLDDGFGIERVVFPGLDYIRAIADPALKIGSFIEWDDAGLGAPAREFWSLLNRAVGMVAQSSRFRRLILWVTLPDKSFLDAQPRKLVDVHLEFMRRDKPDEPIAARVYLPETNAKSGKIYYKHPRQDYGEGPEVLEIIRFREAPPAELADLYERRKANYMMNFYREMVEGIETGGLKIDDYQSRLILTLLAFGKRLDLTQSAIAKKIGIRADSFSRAVAKARIRLGEPAA